MPVLTRAEATTPLTVTSFRPDGTIGSLLSTDDHAGPKRRAAVVGRARRLPRDAGEIDPGARGGRDEKGGERERGQSEERRTNRMWLHRSPPFDVGQSAESLRARPMASIATAVHRFNGL